jgi:UDP-glucose 4-epimerase
MRENLNRLNVLVAGGAGFIGSHLVDALLNINAKKVIAVDNLFCGKIENLDAASKFSNYRFIYGDICKRKETEAIIVSEEIDVVFNCSTKALNYSFINPYDSFNTNTEALLCLLEIQRNKKFKTLCHFSSSEVFGSSLTEPMNEEHPMYPTTAYAAGKAACDMLISSYQKMFDLDLFTVRPFNNFGPRQNWSDPLAAVIPRTIKRILEDSKPEIHGNGMQYRDFTYVQDTVNIVLKLYSMARNGDFINIASGKKTYIKDLVTTLIERLNKKNSIDIEYVSSRVADVKAHIGCTKKLESYLTYEFTDFNKALIDTIHWYDQKFHHNI